MPHVPTVSNAQADRAADRFRGFIGAPLDRDALRETLGVIVDYRAMHAYPLRKVTYGVRVMIESELGPGAPRPGQRLKRLDRITAKLLRFPTMRLSQMEDIGGCRAVLESLEEVYAVGRRLRRRWSHAREFDYIAEPKVDGYRSLHIVERRDGRQIEVQLRTVRQHRWAEAVEDALALTGHDAKNGQAPDDLQLYFALAADRLALEDADEPPDDQLERDFVTLREQIRHYYAAGP